MIIRLFIFQHIYMEFKIYKCFYKNEYTLSQSKKTIRQIRKGGCEYNEYVKQDNYDGIAKFSSGRDFS